MEQNYQLLVLLSLEGKVRDFGYLRFDIIRVFNVFSFFPVCRLQFGRCFNFKIQAIVRNKKDISTI